ncbi:hypothetical protein M3661_08395 [Paenibacillus sp. MER 180]|uniref:hypothetical protein n=1 Tax=Paenibacillus sp. MER 180 TaxID=2939570 RepID=UPI00203DAB2F|nr:hypothetical protein [Paenibacillus sp. MER 180]MCM3290145.1 hypothetical protein [Paenibacillus sp. MER 180]
MNTTTTELLSGKGADLIDLNVSGLPIGKYVDKQVLVNLSEIMSCSGDDRVDSHVGIRTV